MDWLVANLWLWVFGCVGITLIITTGKVFASLRIYLRGFVVLYNPLRVFGELISCPMCTGFWVGFLWSWLVVGVFLVDAVLWGGVISLASYVVDEGLLLIERITGERVDEREQYLMQKQLQVTKELKEDKHRVAEDENNRGGQHGHREIGEG